MGEEITTIDFDVGGDWDDDDFDPTRPRLENATKTGHPFSVSWSREVRAVLSGLDSERLKDADGPWVTESPFDLTDVRELRAAIIPDSTGGGGLSSTGQYRDGMSTMSESGTDHLSAGLGISVGYPFLKASVSGKYDKKVTEDKNVSHGFMHPATVWAATFPGAPCLRISAERPLRSRPTDITLRRMVSRLTS